MGTDWSKGNSDILGDIEYAVSRLKKNQCFDEITFFNPGTEKKFIIVAGLSVNASEAIEKFAEMCKQIGENSSDFYMANSRRYHIVFAPHFDEKPKKRPPNFARFQNDFSNRRKYQKL